MKPQTFVVLPEHGSAARFARGQRLAAYARHVDHASGQPFVVGEWSAGELRVLAAGRTRVVVAGRCLADMSQLHAEVQRAASTESYDPLAAFPGSYHVLVTTDRGLRLFGDVVGFRRLYYTMIGPLPIVSNRSEAIAFLSGATISERWLAQALASPALPPPLCETTPWNGVRGVPPGHRLSIDAELDVSSAAYWNPPPACQQLSEGAPILAAALQDAVRGRVRPAVRASCDLSGGKDSTVLSFLADRAAAVSSVRLLAVTLPSIAPDNDDQGWAQQAAVHLPRTHHVVVDERECPLPYQDLHLDRPWVDEPSTFGMHSARYRHLADILRRHGSEVHLTGHGGDDVIEAPLAYLRDSLRSRPWRAIAHARGHAGLAGTSFLALLASLPLHGSYRSWLWRLADDCDPGRRRPGSRGRVVAGWTGESRLPPWITAKAAASVRDDLRVAAQDVVRPVVSSGQFAAVCRVQAIGRAARLHQEFMSRLGVLVEFPYLDRVVVEACLAVRGDERTTPWRYKPLLDAAMTGTLPPHLSRRTSKGHYTEDTVVGLRRQHSLVAAILADSALSRRGLIDSELLRESLARTAWDTSAIAAFTTTLACELWLRDAEARRLCTPHGRGDVL